MSKLKYDGTQLKNLIKPSLANSEKSLRTASINANFSVPNDFRYRSYLINLRTTISNCASEISNCNDWLESAMKNVSDTMSTIEQRVNGLEIPNIKQKDNSVVIR